MTSNRIPIRWKVKEPFEPIRGLIRMSWDKLNLYNLAMKRRTEDLSRKTVYQQQWSAKRQLRAYHLPNITEKQLIARHWKNQLPLRRMSAADAERMPPVQALAFAELERRVDTVVFRSHFARSIWNARAIVTQGHVKVNGEKCVYPARRLEVGDMVTVDPSVIPTLMKQASNALNADEASEESGESSIREENGEVSANNEDVQNENSTTASSDTSTESRKELLSELSSSDLNSPAESVAGPKAPMQEMFDPDHPNALPFYEIPYMSPWMFIPTYLEVSYPVCSTILVRSPLPQPDRVEIPSPLPPDMHSLVYEWYSNRKRRMIKRRDSGGPLSIGGMAVRLKPRFDRAMRIRQYQLREAAAKFMANSDASARRHSAEMAAEEREEVDMKREN